MRGLVFDIKRFAIHDGPGIRTTIFFKGCPLSCFWCHNPESKCFDTESYMHVDKLDGKIFNKEKNIGDWMTVEKVIDEIEKDKMFHEESGGGVTFSGGEPFQQYEFLNNLLVNCRKRNIHIVLDTTGYVKRELLENVYNMIDLFLYDLKHMDNRYHRECTGVSNELILKNLEWLSDRESNIVIRFPVVPGYNDSEKNIDLMLSFLERLYPNVKYIDLLPYHKMSAGKVERFGVEKRIYEIKEPCADKLKAIGKKFEEIGFEVKIGG